MQCGSRRSGNSGMEYYWMNKCLPLFNFICFLKNFQMLIQYLCLTFINKFVILTFLIKTNYISNSLFLFSITYCYRYSQTRYVIVGKSQKSLLSIHTHGHPNYTSQFHSTKRLRVVWPFC